jgi:ABC-type multidrug transport system ATPase subunit
MNNSPSALGSPPECGILVTDAGKRFNREWIFRHFTYSFQTPGHYAITGPNGSGKSTLLQVIAGNLQMSEGDCKWSVNGILCADENVFTCLSMTAPYLEVIEEMTVKEFLVFHSSFKSLIPSLTIPQIIHLTGLEKAADKQIRYYSSGMKQRVKLAQAVFSDTPVLLLDEPCTNLDAAGYILYHQLIEEYCSKKLIIVSSNDEMEMKFCQEKIPIMDYK